MIETIAFVKTAQLAKRKSEFARCSHAAMTRDDVASLTDQDRI
jgi:hypothetical protein